MFIEQGLQRQMQQAPVPELHELQKIINNFSDDLLNLKKNSEQQNYDLNFYYEELTRSYENFQRNIGNYQVKPGDLKGEYLKEISKNRISDFNSIKENFWRQFNPNDPANIPSEEQKQDFRNFPTDYNHLRRDLKNSLINEHSLERLRELSKEFEGLFPAGQQSELKNSKETSKDHEQCLPQNNSITLIESEGEVMKSLGIELGNLDLPKNNVQRNLVERQMS